MKTIVRRISAILPVAAGLCLSPIGLAEEAPPALTDPGWPREFTMESKKLTIYQPQVDEWKDHSTMHVRCAIEIEGVLAEPKFGVAEIEARTLVDQTTRTVKLFATKRELRFAGVSEAEEKSLRDAVDKIRPPSQLITVSLDRVLPCLDPETAGVQKQVDVSLAPPKIFYSNKPAVLVIFMGEPQFKPVVASDPGLMFAVNTNWDVFYQPSTKAFYLLNGDHWLTAKSADGAWSVATSLPDQLKNLPDDENWAEIRKNIPGKNAAIAEHVFPSKEPAELLITTGDPEYAPIPETKLLEITNTESLLMLDSAGGKFYYQVAGRWFRAPKLEGPWEAASSDLPEDFTRIPDDHPLSFVKATVPGTEEAKDAVLLASVPQSTFVDSTKAPTLEVTYKGEPDFQLIPTTTVKYAVNSPYSVFLVDNGYYCCDQGVWFTAKAATGPWAWSTSVPDAIYTIPVSSPAHNVTYVTVKESTPDTVVYTQTSGYSGEYVAANGVLMFGAGLIVGALINDYHDHYCYPPAAWYSYGCGAVYHYGYGGYYGAAGRVYGPYGGAGYAAAYNPATGVYSRGAYAYGPYGSAGYRQAYNPYTGTYAAAGYRATPYGTVSGGRVYNPYTGASAAGGRVSTAYGSAGRAAAYNPVTGKAATAGYASGERGTVAGGRTNQGTGAVAWDTQNGQGGVAKTRNDNVYAAHNGNVYKKDSDGNWSSNTGNGWKPAEPAQPKAGTQPERPTTQPARPTTQPQRPTTQPQRPTTQPATRQSLDSMSRSRERGSVQTQRTQSFQRSAPSGGGARSSGGGRSGGGGSGRRR
ncbi:MAG: hypothetical protein RLZZ505_1539 [Verrucomicrobiota bacterium]